MSNKPSGRFSNYPKVNRGVSSDEPKEVVVRAPEPEEVVDTAPEPEEVVAPTPEPEEVADDGESTETAESVEDEGASDEAAEDVAEAAFIGADDISEMTAKEVLDWVGDDLSRREYALATESSGRERKTLLSRLAEG
jgi:hypothetical protein